MYRIKEIVRILVNEDKQFTNVPPNEMANLTRRVVHMFWTLLYTFTDYSV